MAERVKVEDLPLSEEKFRELLNSNERIEFEVNISFDDIIKLDIESLNDYSDNHIVDSLEGCLYDITYEYKSTDESGNITMIVSALLEEYVY
jgi:hypothetical protein